MFPQKTLCMKDMVSILVLLRVKETLRARVQWEVCNGHTPQVGEGNIRTLVCVFPSLCLANEVSSFASRCALAMGSKAIKSTLRTKTSKSFSHNKHFLIYKLMTQIFIIVTGSSLKHAQKHTLKCLSHGRIQSNYWKRNTTRSRLSLVYRMYRLVMP